MNMRKMSVVAAGALCVSGVAAADGMDVYLCFDGIDRGRAVEINYVAGDNWDAAARTDGWSGGEAGELKFNNGSFKAFCAEIDVPLSGGECDFWKRVNVADVPTPDPMGQVKAGVMRSHFSLHYAGLSTGTLDEQNDKYAAFALVIWEIAQEGWNGTNLLELDFDLGAVQLDSQSTSVMAEANGMLNNLNSSGTMNLYGWSNPELQDLITVVPGPSIALAGVIGLAGIRRRRRN